MSQTPHVGTTVLHYRVIRAIGSGGMGVVYEAEDTRLGRRVALKFLPPALARDRPALERFEREARAASALNHPNICTVYAIEHSDGEHFIAMELLDGESFDRRFAAPQSWENVVDVGVQVADALEAAHVRGIIHRDIKPANLFLTRSGRVKILDFGVAKIAAAPAGDAETVRVETPEARLTEPGSAVGTVAYMSPEQARGEEIDARSDLFSLAAVLYELATGRAAFNGRTSALIFQQILAGTPDPPTSANPALPPKLEEIVLKGLEKDRDFRYQTAAELRGDLKRLKRDASAGKLALTPSSSAAAAVRPPSSGSVLAAEVRRRKGLAGVVAAAMLATAAAAAYGIYALLSTPTPTPATAAAAERRLEVTRVTTAGDARGCGSISPDGKYVVYCDFGGRLFVRQVASGTTLPLGAGDGATTFSRDGNYIYLSTDSAEYPSGVLEAIPAIGGDRQRVLTNIHGAVGVSPDGQHLAFIRIFVPEREMAIMITDAAGGNERRLLTLRVGEAHFEGGGVSWSHDGKWLAATQALVAGGFRMRPIVVEVATGRMQALGTQTWAAVGRTAWLPDNRLLFAAHERQGGSFQFWVAAFPNGPTTRVTDDARGFGDMSVSVSADGTTIATVPWDIVSNIFETNADATAPLVQWTTGLQRDGEERVVAASEGRVYFDTADGRESGISAVDKAGGPRRRLTRSVASLPSVPADGRFVIFTGLHEGRLRIWRMQPDGSDARVLTRGEDDYDSQVSPDGRWVYYVSIDGVHRIPSDGGVGVRLTGSAVNLIDVSPDGRRLLVAMPDDQSKQFSLALLDAQTGAVLSRPQLPRDSDVRWGRSDDLLAYLVATDGVTNLWEHSLTNGVRRQLTKFTSGRMPNFGYSVDRKRLFLVRGTRTGDVTLIRGFQ